jgi:hypothetical protein
VVNGVASMTKGFIYSYTPNIKAVRADMNFGLKYPYVIQVDAGVTIADERVNTLSFVDLSQVLDATETPSGNWSNVPSLGQAFDPFNYLAGHASAFNPQQSGFDGGFVDLTGASMRTNGMTLGGATRADITDAVGDSNAGEITYTETWGAIVGGSSSATAGRGVFAELDLLASGATALTSALLEIYSGSNPTPILRRYISLPATWRTVRFFFVPNATDTLSFQVKPGDYSAGVKTKMKIGRARIYNASEPVNPGAAFRQARLSATPGAILDGDAYQATITVAGAALGDLAVASFNLSLGGCGITAEARTEQVVVTILNNSGGTVTLGAGELFVRVFKQ